MKNLPKGNDLFKIDFNNISDDNLISLRTEIEKQFKIRNIKFTAGEIGETVAVNFFKNNSGLDNLQKAPVGTKNVDALSRRGERYSIKTIKDGNKSGTIYPDAIDKDKQLFEFILLVLLDEDFKLKALYKFSWIQFLEIRQWDKTMNAWYIPKTLKALKSSEILYERTI